MKRVESEGAAQLRQIEDMRLDVALGKVWPGVEAGDLKAIDMFAKLHDRRVKLHGLAVPEKLVIAQTGPSAETFVTSLAQDFAALGVDARWSPPPLEDDPDGERWANT
ncbi:hypothetical protein IU477_30210 [Nocardia cyriacigeorgica]|nr:hypothetical protein [Nocardia cyriacigeorgica]